VPDGQAPDPVAQVEVVGQVDVKAGTAVAGAGDGQQVADLGGGFRAGPVQGPAGRLGPEPAGRRGELAHPVGGAAGPAVPAGVDHRGPPLHPRGGEHLGPGRVPAGLAGEERLHDLGLLEHVVVGHGGAEGLQASGHAEAFLIRGLSPSAT
jgi:hypothetical protein